MIFHSHLSFAIESGFLKGSPLNREFIACEEIAAKKWNLLKEDVPLPAAVIRSSALQHNSDLMSRFLKATGASLCPHAKTTMSPSLFDFQMQAGAWGLTVATTQQLFVARRFGCPRIIFANQLVGKAAIDYVVSELNSDPELDFYCLVDSVEGVQHLLKGLAHYELKRPLQVLLELGASGFRCGCRTREDAICVARAVANSGSKLALRGLETFEGLFQFRSGTHNSVLQLIEFLLEVARIFDDEALFSAGEVILSAGGSCYFDIVADVLQSARLSKPFRVVLRSGCYLIHDSGHYSRCEEERNRRRLDNGDELFHAEPALEVWAYVQSIPEPMLAILTAGKRDCGYDAGLPVPIKWFRVGLHKAPAPLKSGYVVRGLNDQHAQLTTPPHHTLRIGDMVALGISHPCTTFDKWRRVMVVDDEYNVTSAIESFF